LQRAEAARRAGKSPSTQAGEFVREEMHHVREGQHGARSTKQIIAIGLSKARRAGVDLPPPEKGTVSEKTRRSAKLAYQAGQSRKRKISQRRSSATKRALKREGSTAASRNALSRQARTAARKRSPTSRSRARAKQRAQKDRAAEPPQPGGPVALVSGAVKQSRPYAMNE
jgi:hypothetical protein